MAEVLEAMGFPSEWCERALKSTSGLETAVDLLLQWQAQGMPQYNLQPSVRPSSSPPRSPSSAGMGVPGQQQQNNSRSAPSGPPTLRLQPLPATTSKPVIVHEREQSPSSTLVPSTSSTCPSSLETPSGVNHPCDSESPSSSFPRDVGVSGVPSVGRINPLENKPQGGFRSATPRSSAVEGVSRATTGRGGSRSSRTEDSVDNNDAVVPDAYAEERKARYAAARRAKQEKEEEKARIRQHMQEDMANRRLRNNYFSTPESDSTKSSLPAVGERSGAGSPSNAVSKDAAVELQIRCPGNQNLRASFTAGASLKDVRAYVHQQLQQPLRVIGAEDHYSDMRRGSIPFSGHSARLSSDRQAERELLQAARQNFEVQTSRIIASAKSLRDVSGLSQNSSDGTIYFLIPFPRQEFFTETAMDTTLAEAQLVPGGTLVVQYRQSELKPTNSVQFNAGNSETKANVSDNDIHQVSRPETAEASWDEAMPMSIELEPDSNQGSGVPNFENSSFDSAINESMKSRLTLEMEGERVRLRERALQAAAKRMSEAARIFRAGLPLVEGETEEAFHFPRDAEHRNMANNSSGKGPEEAAAVVGASVPLPVDHDPIGLKPAGADADMLDAGSPTDEHPIRSDNRPDDLPVDRSRNALHLQAVAAAELRMRNPQPQAAVLGGGFKQDPEEAESRIGDNEVDSPPMRARARIPQSSRLLSRPEKLQRTSSGSGLNNFQVAGTVERQMAEQSSHPRQSQLSIGTASRAAPLEAALQRCKATSETDNKGKGIVEEHESLPAAVPSSSVVPVETLRNSSLRVRLQDGNVVLRTFPASTVLEEVRDSVLPEGGVASEYGFVVPFPEPHFVEGDALRSTLEEVGLVPRGTIHLTALSTRGMVRQGRRVSRRRRYVGDSDDEEVDMESMIRHLREHIEDRPELSYEEMMDLEESIGRVNVGVPEEVITTLPTHIVKAKKIEITEDNAEPEPDLCIVCMAEMVDGEEALSLPCFHTFHTLCIRQWLFQSTCCPTCKQALV